MGKISTCKWENFLPLDIENVLPSQFKWQTFYSFFLYQMANIFSHLQMYIFSHSETETCSYSQLYNTSKLFLFLPWKIENTSSVMISPHIVLPLLWYCPLNPLLCQSWVAAYDNVICKCDPRSSLLLLFVGLQISGTICTQKTTTKTKKWQLIDIQRVYHIMLFDVRLHTWSM